MKRTLIVARNTSAWVGGALLALGLCACLDNKLVDEEPDAGKKKVFIAQQRDFLKYLDWMVFDKDVPGSHGGVIGKTTVYLNELPPQGSAEFPVGTMLLKTMQATDSPDMSIHAMVKRGSGFNPKGALGWEFFELALQKKDGMPFILWRGTDPPTGEMYKLLLGANDLMPMEAESDCNSCHAYDAKDGTFDRIATLLK
jgi:hypothetical protein